MSRYSSSVSPSWRRLVTGSTLAVIISALAITTPAAREAGEIVPSSVPDALQVPAGHIAAMIASATGTQNYICLLAPGGFTWTFLGPQATLFDASGGQITTHFLSPNPNQGGTARATWQDSSDTSTVWAAAIATYAGADYVNPDSIPWLLLRVVGSQAGPTGGQMISNTTYIQRVNTVGGVAPATGCSHALDIGKKALVPYTTDYVFYRAQ